MIARKGGALCGLFIVAAVCVSWDRVVSGQNRDGGRRPQAVVRGTVTAADSGLPLRLAEVQISGGSLKSPLVVLTDSSGGYELRDLPAGQYSLTAWKLGYVKTGYKGGRSGEGKLLVVDGQSAEATTIDFSLPRAGVIVASVTDEYGEPVAGAWVSVLRAEGSAPQRKLVDASGNGFIATTDDRGEVRLFNLAPGTYYAAARKSALSRVGSRRQATAQVFYPGTLSQADAQPITLAAGVEVRVPIPLIDGRLARVSGVVLSSGGEPDPASTVQLTNVGAAISTGQPVTRSPDGQFLATGRSLLAGACRMFVGPCGAGLAGSEAATSSTRA
jgi:hypothetical protein